MFLGAQHNKLMASLKATDTHPSELLEIILDIFECGGRRQTTDKYFLRSGNHLKKRKEKCVKEDILGMESEVEKHESNLSSGVRPLAIYEKRLQQFIKKKFSAIYEKCRQQFMKNIFSNL